MNDKQRYASQKVLGKHTQIIPPQRALAHNELRVGSQMIISFSALDRNSHSYALMPAVGLLGSLCNYVILVVYGLKVSFGNLSTCCREPKAIEEQIAII